MNFNGLEDEFKTVNGEIVDFKQIEVNGSSPLIYALLYNRRKNLNLSNEQFDYLIKKSNLKQVHTNNNWSPLMIAISWNKTENLNLSNEQIVYMIKKSNLKIVNSIKQSVLMCALEFNDTENLNLKNEDWKYLIEHSDLSLIKAEKELIKLKQIQTKLLNDEILNKIEIKEKINKKFKI